MHLVQPLDVVIFHPLKHYHIEVIDLAISHGDIHFQRREFLTSLYQIRMESMKPKTIRSSSKKAMLVRFNPQEVLILLSLRPRIIRILPLVI